MNENVIEIYGMPSIIVKSEEDFHYEVFYNGSLLDLYKINDVLIESIYLSRVKIFSIQDPKKLEILAKDKDSYVRTVVAEHQARLANRPGCENFRKQ